MAFCKYTYLFYVWFYVYKFYQNRMVYTFHARICLLNGKFYARGKEVGNPDFYNYVKYGLFCAIKNVFTYVITY